MPRELAHTPLLGRQVLSDVGVRLVGEATLRALDRQARAGLGTGASGDTVTLHGKPQTLAIWESAEVQADGSIRFGHSLAHLLTQYGADTLRGQHLADLEAEVSRILEEHLTVED